MVRRSTLRTLRRRSRTLAFRSLVFFVAALLAGGEGTMLASLAVRQQAPAPAPNASDSSARLSGDQLESLVAPIALYPDALLAQCLVASTYPVELIQAQQWVAKNPSLKGDALSNAAMKQDWDPSIQALTGIPDALKMMTQDIKWTVDVGNAFLAQQSDVMDAVQRLRTKAKDGGKLESTEQQKVETRVVEQKQVIVIEQSSPDVIYVPSYSPTVIWGAPAYYPWPPLYYPPYYGGAWFAWGAGVAIGIGIAGGWGCGWGNNDITINNNNNFNRNEINHNRGEGNRGQGNRGDGNRGQGGRGEGGRGQGGRGQGGAQAKGGSSNWSHNPSHRGGAPYGDRASASKFGGQTRGEFSQSRNARTGGASGTQRNLAARDGGGAGRGAGGASARGAGGGGRGGGSSGGGGAGGDRVGNRSVSRPGHSGTGFSGSGSGRGGASASRSRGSSSFGGGGGRSMGGGRGGGGGGRRR